jgi:hypothetical protein
VIPLEPDPERLQAVGAVTARFSSVELTPLPFLPIRSRPIEAEDFAGMRRDQGASDLLRAAEAAVASTGPQDERIGLVHGDLWHGNTLWDGDRLTAVLDWDCAAGRPRLAGPRATFRTGMRSRPSHPRLTWAGSRCRWPFRVGRTSPVTS